jgi:hypothetical protein
VAGWTVLSGGLNAPVPGNPTYPDEIDFWNAYNAANTAVTGSATLATYLLSPSQISGSASHLSSVQFCYGTATSRVPSAATAMTIDNATVVEFTEPATSSTGTYAAPTYTTANLIDQALSLTSQAGCQTVSAATPATITPGGYLKLEVHVSWKLAGASGPDPQVTLELGRVSATYS